MILKKSLTLCIVPLVILTSMLNADELEAKIENLSLQNALELVKKDNLELKIAKFTEQMKAYEAKEAEGHRYGKLDVTLQAIRSNSAGNVFGFKLESREATFGDFGAEEFMNNMGAAQQGDMTAAGRMYSDPPENLNNPKARNHFQTKFSYMVPLYTGGKLTQYKNITNALHTMSKLDTSKLLNEKIFQTTKTFYDISLVDNYILNLGSIIDNINRLDEIVSNMREEGFAKEIDQLEVQARKAEAMSMLSQATFNRELAYQYLSFLMNSDVESIQNVSDMAPMPTVVKEEVQKINLDIRKAKLGLEITDMAVKLQESNFLPEVGAFGEYGSADDNLFNEFLDKDSYTIGVQAKWNLFNGGIDKNNLERAKVENMKVHEQVNLAKRGICLKVRKTMTEIKSENAEIKSLEAQLEFANRVYETYQAQYQEGISSISDVLIKQSKELEVLLKLLTVKNERNTKIFELNSIIDKGDEI
ncbi:TolC family protein [Sulfurovum sp. bin170]|uniref:TolC family protein n=1 Tax=Sulfurovum sp. bin170 TaxID=2695268 RepID=UPI00210539E9|nr:TolC family protein [Sulfurovum sp. bin170]